MSRKEFMKKLITTTLAMSLAITPVITMAAPTSNDALQGTGQTTTNATDVNNDLADHDIIDKDAKGSITIHKYDITSAEQDGLVFNYSDTDHDSDGTDSTLTDKKGSTINITSNGKENKQAADALKEYALKGVEFTYHRVGDVKTLSDVNEDEVNGDIELIYGVDTDLMSILSLKPYDAANKGQGTVAVTQIDGTNYFTSQQIIDALKTALEVDTYKDSYATGEGEGTGTSNTEGNRIDGAAGITVKDALEDYITKAGDAHAAGKAMAETDADGMTKIQDIDLGLYLIVETKVPENVTSTVDPWFVQVPMTTIEGTEWFYDIECYPKNQTGHPTLDKLVRNAYGTAGLNYNSDGPATYTTGNKIDRGDDYSPAAEIVTNGDTIEGSDVGAWLAHDDKGGDYKYSTTVTASEGDLLDYILVTKLPKVTSSATYLKSYEFLDTLSDGLHYNNDVKVAIYNNKQYADVNDTTHAIDVWTLQSGTNYKFTCATSAGKTNGSQTIKISATDEGLAEINKKYYDGNHYLVAYYTATVQSDATTVLGDEGNPNDVTLVWKRTSDEYYNTLEDRSIVYTYGIDLTKTFSDGNKKPEDFRAVKFVLSNETEDYYAVLQPAQTEGLYYVTGKTVDKKKATKISPNSDGYLVVNGMEADHYLLTEVETAKGYSLGQNEFDIVINSASREITPSNVVYMTVDKDHDIEHPVADQNLQLSDGTVLKAKEEGTTDKDNMIVAELAPSSSTVDGKKASMCAYGTQHLGTAEINATPNKTVAAASERADVVMSINNEKGFNLPKTGGTGLYAITIIGFVTVICGAYFVLKDKKDKTIC